MIHQSDAQIIYSDIEYGNSTLEKYQTKLQLKKFYTGVFMQTTT